MAPLCKFCVRNSVFRVSIKLTSVERTSLYFPVSNPTISEEYSCAICRTSGIVLGASGLGKTTIRTPGIPNEVARACAALVNVLVITLTEGTPLDSVITVSWRPHAVQEPQSAMACITTSQSCESFSIISSAHGALYVNLVS